MVLAWGNGNRLDFEDSFLKVRFSIGWKPEEERHSEDAMPNRDFCFFSTARQLRNGIELFSNFRLIIIFYMKHKSFSVTKTTFNLSIVYRLISNESTSQKQLTQNYQFLILQKML